MSFFRPFGAALVLIWAALVFVELLLASGLVKIGVGWLAIFITLGLGTIMAATFEKTSVGIGLAMSVIVGGLIMMLLHFSIASALAPPACYFLFGRIIFRRYVGNYSASPNLHPPTTQWRTDD